MRSYNHPGTTELAKCSWAGTQTISSLDLVRKIDLNVLNTWLAKQELPVRRSSPVRKIDTPQELTSMQGASGADDKVHCLMSGFSIPTHQVIVRPGLLPFFVDMSSRRSENMAIVYAVLTVNLSPR